MVSDVTGNAQTCNVAKPGNVANPAMPQALQCAYLAQLCHDARCGMMTLRLLQTAALLLAPVMAAVAAPCLLHAQSGQRATVTLGEITLLAENPEQSVFRLELSPKAGSYSTLSDDPVRPAVVLMGTARGSNAGLRGPALRGLVRGVEFTQGETGLSVKFAVTAPAKVIAVPSNGNLLVTISKLTGAEALGNRPLRSDSSALASTTDLPKANNPMPGEDGFELVMLKYADVSEIVGLLTDGVTVKPNNTFIRREPGFGSPGTSGAVTYSQNQQSESEDRPLGQSVDTSLAIDRRLNAIWIKGSPQRIARIKAQIAMIDIPVDSVILETQFVELTETGAKAVGIDFNNANGQIGVATFQRGQYSPFGATLTTNVPSFNLQAAIYAQVQKGEGQIVSRPRIAALSGSTAKIITGDALPILTAITLSGVNGVSQQVQYVNVGVTLQIAPRVSPDGFVTSHIYGVVSSVTGYSQGYPTISQREAETSASVRDGETFVIGGLTQENVLTSKSKIPVFGDIPLLGTAFRNNRSNRTKTELYIVITPRIVRHNRFDVQGGLDGQGSGGDAPKSGELPAAKLEPVQ